MRQKQAVRLHSLPFVEKKTHHPCTTNPPIRARQFLVSHADKYLTHLIYFNHTFPTRKLSRLRQQAKPEAEHQEEEEGKERSEQSFVCSLIVERYGSFSCCPYNTQFFPPAAD